MALACVNWRHADRDSMAALYRREVRRWNAIGWDTTGTWPQVELGRQLGTVDGYVLRDGNGIQGWTFFLLHGSTLQVGAFLSPDIDGTSHLLEAVLDSDRAHRATSLTVFAFAEAPGLTAALAEGGYEVDGYAYMECPLTSRRLVAPSPLAPRTRLWRDSDGAATAALLASAYPGPAPARPFASRGEPREWREYVAQLTTAAGCGPLIPGACLVIPDEHDEPRAVILVTKLGAGTAHVAQVAVRADAAGHGFGRSLVEQAGAASWAAGFSRITLLVSSRNTRARRLYEAEGFVETAGFVSAGSLDVVYPRRLTSVAAGGKAITRP